MLNKPPTTTEIDIDGQPFTMQPSGPPPHNYSAGVVYSYTASSLAVGQHYDRYRFDDGSGPLILQGSDGPNVTSVMLVRSSVSPLTGTSTTNFTFQTTYINSNGNAPVLANVYVDGTAFPMSQVGGSYSTGAPFSYTTQLPTSNHSFYFVFADATTRWPDPAAPLTYGGPNAGLNASAAPRLIVAPSPDQYPDPDLPDPGD